MDFDPEIEVVDSGESDLPPSDSKSPARSSRKPEAAETTYASYAAA